VSLWFWVRRGLCWYSTVQVLCSLDIMFHSDIKDCCLLVDLGQKLVVAEKRVLILANLDGAAAILSQNVSNVSCVKRYGFYRHRHVFGLLRTWGIKTLSPGCTLGAILFPSLSMAPGPTASTLASLSSLTAVSGRKIPVAVFASGFMRWTRMRSRRGAIERIDLMADCNTN
jgi:hypothetical protein